MILSMKKARTAQSAFVSLRALLIVLVCGASILTGSLPAFFSSDAANSAQTTLTFAERVAYQRAIEEVYWRHRIWPGERQDPKPPHGCMDWQRDDRLGRK